MKTNFKIITGITSVAIFLIGNAALAQVINGGFETPGANNTGALGWNNDSGAPPTGTTTSVMTNTASPFAGNVELTLSYNNSGATTTGSAEIAQSDLFSASVGANTFSFEAEAAPIGFANPQWQIQWFNAGNAFISASGFTSFNPVTSSYTLKSFSVTAPAGTTQALIQFLLAGSANTTDAALIRLDNVSLTPAPEPTTLALAGLSGIAALSLIRRRK